MGGVNAVTDPFFPTLVPVPDELLSQRLLLRPLRAGDSDAMLKAIESSRENLEHWLVWPGRVHTLDAASNLCLRASARWILREEMRFGVFARDSGGLLGAVSLHDPDWTLRNFEVGYWLCDSAVGHGFAQEAVRLLTIVAFELLDARRVSILCDPRNIRSRQVAERAGFPLETTLRNSSINPQGSARDTLVFAAVTDDYERFRSAWQCEVTISMSGLGGTVVIQNGFNDENGDSLAT